MRSWHWALSAVKMKMNVTRFEVHARWNKEAAMPTTHTIWDVASDNVLMEKNGSGGTIAEYTHEPNRFGELISQRRDGATAYYHFAAQGTVQQLTDDTENTTDTSTYTAFGETVEITGATTNPFGFNGAVGYYANLQTEASYVRARTYQPSIGRWLSQDPMRFVDGMNLYLYVSACPTRLSDPSGMQQLPDPCTDRICKDCVAEYWKADSKDDILKFIWKQLHRNNFQWKRGCRPEIICCPGPDDEECAPCRRAGESGSLEIGTTKIVLCANSLRKFVDPFKGQCQHILEVLRHELTHLYDQCHRDAPDPNKCDQCICDERRAYIASRMCVNGSAWWQWNQANGIVFTDEADCLWRSISGSCDAACVFVGKTDREKRNKIIRTYYRCYFPFRIDPAERPGGG
jgi:RHS repeat-associated protein